MDPRFTMSVRRKVPNAKVARSCLDALHRSGLPLVEWCASAGIDGRSLHCWRLAFARRAGRGAGQRFVELVPAPAHSSIAEAEASPRAVPPPLRVQLGDVVIDVAVGFHADSLAEVLRVVRAC